MPQYNEKMIADFFSENGFSGKSGYYKSCESSWVRAIWVQGGIGSRSGTYTINFDFINKDLQRFYFPNITPGKGSALLSIRIGELIGSNDRWYNPIVSSLIDKTTKEAIVDINKALIEFDKIDSPVRIAEILWKQNHIYPSLIVMSSYLKKNKMSDIIKSIPSLRNEFSDKLHQYSESASSQSVKGK